MRVWDENAKYPGLEVPGFETHAAAIRASVQSVGVSSEVTRDRAFYLRQGNAITGLRF